MIYSNRSIYKLREYGVVSTFFMHSYLTLPEGTPQKKMANPGCIKWREYPI